ncbi:monooxygenase [Coemansia erecta]|uniref:Monooxygenase n=1 Tax=Coemansia erecta TaxID=147472 RepID=A0A9W7XY14_9FUNG|nr:monooxygenase [Coemansia erecta]
MSPTSADTSGVFVEPVGDDAKDARVRVRARRIGIIGAGPAGLAAARVFIETGFTSVTVFERNNDIGGVWCYTSDAVCHYNIPQDSADTALLSNYDERCEFTGGFPTPLYNELHTNLPTDNMQFTDFPFPPSTPEFPSRHEVQAYVRAYADTYDLRRLVQLNTEVTNIRYTGGQWRCRVRRLENPTAIVEETLTFDALVVCSGRVSHPYIPDVKGLRELYQNFPQKIIAAKEFRRPEEHKGQNVLVVGGAFSAFDISRQLSYTVASLHVSMAPMKDEELNFDGFNKQMVPTVHPLIEKYTGTSVVFTDGTEIPLPDLVIYATGYLYMYPFADNQHPELLACPEAISLKDAATQLLPLSDGQKTNDLYKYLVYIYNPTLAILGVPFNIAPFPFYEYQSHYLAHLLRGDITLPSFAKMKEEWDTLVHDRPGKLVNKMGMDQIPYRNDLLEAVDQTVNEDKCIPRKRLYYITPDMPWAARLRMPELHREALGYGRNFVS